jgi:hypothetical protein
MSVLSHVYRNPTRLQTTTLNKPSKSALLLNHFKISALLLNLAHFALQSHERAPFARKMK